MPRQLPDPAPGALTLRVLSLNVRGGRADPAAVVRALERHQVDVLVVQELTPGIVHRLADAGIGTLLPYCHLDPRPRGGWDRALGMLALDSPATSAGPGGGGTPCAHPASGRLAGDGDRGASEGPNAPQRAAVAAGTGRHPVDAGRHRRAASSRGGLQRQPGPPAVPRSAGSRFPGLRRRRPAAPVAGLHLARRPVDPPGHAAGPRPRFPWQRHGQRVTGDPGSRYRPSGGPCGYPADVSATTSHRSSSEAFSSWIARSCRAQLDQLLVIARIGRELSRQFLLASSKPVDLPLQPLQLLLGRPLHPRRPQPRPHPCTRARPRRRLLLGCPPGQVLLDPAAEIRQLPVPEQRDHVIGHPLQEIPVVTDHHQRPRPPVKQVLNLGQRLNIQIISRLIQQHHIRLVHQQPQHLHPAAAPHPTAPLRA